MKVLFDESPIKLSHLRAACFGSEAIQVCLDPSLLSKVTRAEAALHALLERRIPIYGVTTGFGENCTQFVDRSRSIELQDNLISYLAVGTGPVLPREVSRAAFVIRLKSLSRGYSGVSVDLLARMQLFLERDWIPVIPREGSLGASGDLVPLAYLGLVLRGDGKIWSKDGPKPTGEVLARAGVEPYRFKPKEGLALVNGTSAMAAYALYCVTLARSVVDRAIVGTAWACLALKGRTEAFSELVNTEANRHPGQSYVAKRVRESLAEESYAGSPLEATRPGVTQGEPVQDPYSIRCVPQIFGPIVETLDLVERWIETEVNGTSDNPLFSEDGSIAMGGNFYGGYLAHAMDYLKICLAHVADTIDRQVMLLVSPKSSRGLPPNLADYAAIPEAERFLHHGLKGLHQSISAITSEIMAKATPNAIFSRSSESHNQDKVSLGMSAASQCADLLDALHNLQAMALVCGVQALDLRKIELQSEHHSKLAALVRSSVPRVSRDTPLWENLSDLSAKLKASGLRC